MGPHDAFSEGSFQPPNFRRDDWRPPLWARTLVWIVKDVGVPVSALIVMTAVLLGWVDSPLMRLRDIDVRTVAALEAITKHADASMTFQAALLDSLRKGRCMTVLASLLVSAEALTRAGLSQDPCSTLENLPPPSRR